MELWTCSKCGIEKPPSEYHKNGNRRRSSCISCEKLRSKTRRDYFRQRDKDLRKTNPIYRVKGNIRRRVRLALFDHKRIGSTSKSIGCSTKELKAYIESKFQSGMTWENYGKWHIDHIRPLASFNLNDPKDFEKANHYSNLQPLWAEDNVKKSDKY